MLIFWTLSSQWTPWGTEKGLLVRKTSYIDLFITIDSLQEKKRRVLDWRFSLLLFFDVFVLTQSDVVAWGSKRVKVRSHDPMPVSKGRNLGYTPWEIFLHLSLICCKLKYYGLLVGKYRSKIFIVNIVFFKKKLAKIDNIKNNLIFIQNMLFSKIFFYHIYLLRKL